MSDAVCGPSNPLQQFRKQTQLDRTLQQDRLTSRASSAQGFRSTSPQVGLLDPQFEAFQAGVPPSELPQYQHLPTPQNHARAHPEGSWASDFQRLQVSSPVPLNPVNFNSAISAGPANVAWAQDFRTHVAQTIPRAHSASPSPQAFQQRARFGLTGFQSQFAQPNYAPVVQSKGKQPATQTFDEAAFDQAFDQAREDMMEEHAQTPQMDDVQQVIDETLADEDKAKFEAELAKVNQAAEEFSRREQMLRAEETQSQMQRQQDDDALAATAQELLEKVEHNQTDKFKNSQFLGLMRKLRDREVKVEGDKMVETAGVNTSADLGMSSLHGPNNTHAHLLDDTEPRPSPLGGHAGLARADIRPPERSIPQHEQDHDWGRMASSDGQAVIDLLRQPGDPADREDLGTTAAGPI